MTGVDSGDDDNVNTLHHGFFLGWVKMGWVWVGFGLGLTQ